MTSHLVICLPIRLPNIHPNLFYNGGHLAEGGTYVKDSKVLLTLARLVFQHLLEISLWIWERTP